VGSSHTPIRILSLTQDRELISQIEAEINRHAPAEILVTDDGLELVEEQAVRRTSIIILDADLLADRLLRLITILRTVDSHCRIVLFLSADNLPLCEQALPLGQIWYFFKPVPVENAANLICSCLHIPVDEAQ